MATAGPSANFRTARVVAAIAVVLAFTGCGGGTDDRLPPAQTPTPTTSSTPTVDPEDAAAFAVVEGYLRALTSALTEAGDVEDLAAYTIPREVELLAGEIQLNRREGIIYTGGIGLDSMRITDRDRPAGPTEPAAGAGVLVEACLDGGDWRLVDRDSGDLVGADPESHDTRHIGRFLVFPAADGDRWTRFTSPIPAWHFGDVEDRGVEAC